MAVLVTDELFGRGAVNAGITAEDGHRLFLSVVQSVDFGPLRPWVVYGASHRGLGKDLKLDEAMAAVTHRSPNAVRARVAAADDNNILAFGGNEILVRLAGQYVLRVRRQEVHGEMDALQVAALDAG